jgi:hypothetical protein
VGVGTSSSSGSTGLLDESRVARMLDGVDGVDGVAARRRRRLSTVGEVRGGKVRFSPLISRSQGPTRPFCIPNTIQDVNPLH